MGGRGAAALSFPAALGAPAGKGRHAQVGDGGELNGGGSYYEEGVRPTPPGGVISGMCRRL